jgi:flagellar biosynthesis protein FlhB
MSGDDLQDKTEAATSKKLADARNKGQVAKSKELTAAVLLFIGILSFYFASGYFLGGLTDAMRVIFTHLNVKIENVETMSYWAKEGIMYIVGFLAPLFFALVLAALSVNLYQVGFTISFESIKPKLSNANLFDIAKYKRFFNTEGIMRLVMGLMKLSALGTVCYLIIMGSMEELMNLMNGTYYDIFAFLGGKIFLIGLWTAVLLLIIGVIDFTYQKWRFQEQMKMTKQELKEERKQTEGDAHVKAKLRSMMQQFIASRMKGNVPKSDVIIANPVHYAIAIKYDPENMPAPLCMAKGARKMAEGIKELAKKHDVPIVENPPLARALFKVVEVGELVPPEFYHSVAEVLAYVYRLNDELDEKQSQFMPGGTPIN